MPHVLVSEIRSGTADQGIPLIQEYPVEVLHEQPAANPTRLEDLDVVTLVHLALEVGPKLGRRVAAATAMKAADRLSVASISTRQSGLIRRFFMSKPP